MNAISIALVGAGIRLPPLNKRVWLWVKDHPDTTSNEVAKALGETQPAVATQLKAMSARKMMVMRDALPPRHSNRKSVKRYSTCLKEWELLPLPFKPKGKPPVRDSYQDAKAVDTFTKPLFPETKVIEAIAPIKIRVPGLVKGIPRSLENHSLVELRDLYGTLQRLFGG